MKAGGTFLDSMRPYGRFGRDSSTVVGSDGATEEGRKEGWLAGWLALLHVRDKWKEVWKAFQFISDFLDGEQRMGGEGRKCFETFLGANELWKHECLPLKDL